MEGLIALGMKHEALRLARRNLYRNPIASQEFNDALNAILTLADRTKPWATAVEAAYERLLKRDRALVRFWMISFRSSTGDYKGVLRLTPKRFSREFSLMELAFAMEAAFDLHDIEVMEKASRRLRAVINQADNPMTYSLLLLCLAEYLGRKGRWDEAIAALEGAPPNETLHRNFVARLAEAHVVRALLAVRQGLQRLDEINQTFDPVAETIVPGNDKHVRDQARNDLRRLQKKLEKIVRAKRQQQLGLLPGG
jgi:tetratricopeptide (TPR) repeat protein